MNGPVQQFYRSREAYFLNAEKRLAVKIRSIVIFRLLAFLFIPLSYFFFHKLGFFFWAIPSFVSFGVFLFLVKKHLAAEKKQKRFSVQAKLATDEIQALNHRFLHFPDGAEYLDPGHPYSYDLDLFGKGSLFQYLNRTSTASGKNVLAAWLMNPPLEPGTIETRQEAVKELAAKRDWRLGFLTSGKMFDETLPFHNEVIEWSKTELPFKRGKLTRILIKILPVLTLLTLVPAIGVGFWAPFYGGIFSQWAIMYFFRRKIKEYFRFFGQKSLLIEKYVSLLDQIGNEKFDSSWMVQQQSKILSPEAAGRIIAKLGKLVREFEFRQNLLVGFTLNSIFLWDVRCVYLLWEWHLKNRHKLAEWLGVLETTDALISLANFADNNPSYVFPKIEKGSFNLSAKNLGHPLLDPKKRINNDFSVEGWSKIMIVTGANMAGKSTFLRAVGTNLILARAGMPVCADGFIFTPAGIYTNMRTTDSLFDDESYFFAELKRLSNMLTRIENGEKLFVILDEMLKGTNSVDKLNGSKELVKKMIRLKTVALIATHDLKLSEMENDFPENVFNKCFEIKIDGSELVFDFKLSDGVTKTMNATFLMKKMGIIGNDED